jgi:hypothetical protein
VTPRQWQFITVAMLVVAAALLQSVVAARLPLPGPPLGIAVAVVIGIGLATGANVGAIAGFSSGLLLDVMPPAHGPLGLSALMLLMVGALAGRVRDPRGLAPAQLAGLAAGLAGLSWMTSQALLWVLGYPTGAFTAMLWFCLGVILLSIVVVPAEMWLLRRLGAPGARFRSSRRSLLPR